MAVMVVHLFCCGGSCADFFNCKLKSENYSAA
ncbi:MAG: hypothetical protein GKS01_10560 [Alphaproteobacteria bacterium]|nr:hypothetical protein [Alphaproteobacteria bacterium]